MVFNYPRVHGLTNFRFWSADTTVEPDTAEAFMALGLKPPTEGKICNIFVAPFLELKEHCESVTTPMTWGAIKGVAKIFIQHGHDNQDCLKSEDQFIFEVLRVETTVCTVSLWASGWSVPVTVCKFTAVIATVNLL
jgi:hypothetical protein